MTLIEYLVPFVVVLGVLIFIHELGHFLAAKAFGVKVERFSLGFGPAIWSRTRGETEYRVAWLPLGGYVKLLGEVPGETLPEGEAHRTLNARPIWQRIAIFGAGPGMNFLLPVVLLGAAYLVGVPTVTSRIGEIIPGSPAEIAGLEAGDRILAVGGRPVEWWEQAADGLVAAAPGRVPLEVERRGERLGITFELPGAIEDPTEVGLNRAAPAAVIAVASTETPAAEAGLRDGDKIVRVGDREVLDWTQLGSALQGASGRVEIEARRPLGGPDPETVRVSLAVEEGRGEAAALGLLPADLTVQEVEADSPAERAGIRPGDHLRAINGEPLTSFRMLAERIRESRGNPIRMGLLRTGEPLEMELVPERRDVTQQGIKERVFAVGIRGGVPAAPEVRSRRTSNPLLAVAMGTRWSGEIIVRTFEGIGMLISGRVGREGLAGPIGIGVIAAQSFQAGWVQGILIMAVISVNLAILNLLPIPVLDGGHILFALAEGLKGGPVSFRIREVAQQVGLAILFCLMVFAFWNDIARHWSDIIEFFQGMP